MATAISNSSLVDKAMRFLTTDVTGDKMLRLLVQEAIINADRDLRTIDEFSPLAWHIGVWDNLRTVPWADISAITAADPAVITAACSNSNITGHGFHDESTDHQDIVLVDGIDSGGDRTSNLGMEKINARFYLLNYVDSTTVNLKTIDNLDYLDSSSMYAYDSGGSIYHAGFKINTTLIEANVSSEWSFGRIIPYGVTIDGYPCHPVGSFDIANRYELRSIGYAQRPKHYYYWQHHQTFGEAAPTIGHYLFLLPPANTEYNVKILFEKVIADLASWDDTHYPPHPAEVHQALWKGALANLVGNAKKAQRQNEKGIIATQVEVLHAQHWLEEWRKEKLRVLNLHRMLLGEKGGMGSISA